VEAGAWTLTRDDVVEVRSLLSGKTPAATSQPGGEGRAPALIH
jgi:hypothetical protein